MDCTNLREEALKSAVQQVGSKKAFKSTFMSGYLRDFLAGDISVSASSQSDTDLFAIPLLPAGQEAGASPMSPEAQAVYDAGLELWRYYHAQPRANPDAAFYDIRKFFQGEKNGRMNKDSSDAHYTALVALVREKQKALAAKIAAGVYKYGFLR